LLGDSSVRIILGRRSYGFIAALLAVLFAVFYYILEPSNFSSFSNTLRYFISGLSTLLAVVVSFNTLALRNQLNNMPNSEQVTNPGVTHDLGRMTKSDIFNTKVMQFLAKYGWLQK
jgi:hypothetical protein